MPPRQAMASSTAQGLGWVILTAAALRSQALVAPFLLLRISVRAAMELGVMLIPVWVLALAGGIGLIRRRYWGFYAVYLLAVVSLFGAQVPILSGAALFPLIEKAVHFGPLQPYFLMAVNLVIAAALAWTHAELRSGDRWLARRGVLPALVVAGLGLLFAGLWHQRFEYRRQPLASLADLPRVGSRFAGARVRGPVELRSLYWPANGGVMQAFAGAMERREFEQLVTAMQLTRIDREEGWRKMLPLFRTWRLDPAHFPTGFQAADLHYSGRMPGARKLNVQLCWRAGDERFAGQVFGRLASTDALPASSAPAPDPPI